MRWHPDKHPEDPEGAKAKFQEIQRAFTSLMTTDEDEEVRVLCYMPLSDGCIACILTSCSSKAACRPCSPRCHMMHLLALSRIECLWLPQIAMLAAANATAAAGVHK